MHMERTALEYIALCRYVYVWIRSYSQHLVRFGVCPLSHLHKCDNYLRQFTHSWPSADSVERQSDSEHVAWYWTELILCICCPWVQLHIMEQILNVVGAAIRIKWWKLFFCKTNICGSRRNLIYFDITALPLSSKQKGSQNWSKISIRKQYEWELSK